MATYRLKQLVPAEKRRNRLGSFEDPHQFHRELQKITSRIIKALAFEFRSHVLPEAKRDKERLAVKDAASDEFGAAKERLRVLMGAVDGLVEQVLRDYGETHTKRWRLSVDRAFGIDVGTLVSDNDYEDYLRTAVARNVSLIQNVGDDLLKRVENTVYSGVIAGTSQRDLAKQINADLGVASRRSNIIARDQASKFWSDLNRIRHQQAGITSYVWRTSQDERVRSLHRGLEGKQYKYGQQTGAEGGLPPGQPVMCRCTAEPVLEFQAEEVGRGRAEVVPTRRPPAAERKVPLVEKRNAARAAAVEYVVSRGKKTRHEHMVVVDLDTGTTIDTNTLRQKSTVSPGLAGIEAMRDEKRNVVAYHNHPSSSSFSKADLFATQAMPGLKELWANGHNGSNYRLRKGKEKLHDRTYENVRRTVRKELQQLVNAVLLTPASASLVEGHLTNIKLDRLGFIDYQFDLAGRTDQALTDYQEAKKTWQQIQKTASP